VAEASRSLPSLAREKRGGGNFFPLSYVERKRHLPPPSSKERRDDRPKKYLKSRIE
jgi:hypothetical protein